MFNQPSALDYHFKVTRIHTWSNQCHLIVHYNLAFSFKRYYNFFGSYKRDLMNGLSPLTLSKHSFVEIVVKHCKVDIFDILFVWVLSNNFIYQKNVIYKWNKRQGLHGIFVIHSEFRKQNWFLDNEIYIAITFCRQNKLQINL